MKSGNYVVMNNVLHDMLYSSVEYHWTSPHRNSVDPWGHSGHWYRSVCHQGRHLESCDSPSIGFPHNPFGTPHINRSPAEKQTLQFKHRY